MTYHPSSFQVSEFYLSVTRKYCFPTSFDNKHILMRPSRPKRSLYQVPEAGKEGSAVLPWPPLSGFEWMAII